MVLFFVYNKQKESLNDGTRTSKARNRCNINRGYFGNVGWMASGYCGFAFYRVDFDKDIRDPDRKEVVRQMKKRRQSRTLWFNGIMAALIALEASLHYLSSLIPANWYAIIAVVLSVGNAILRVITTTGISK